MRTDLYVFLLVGATALFYLLVMASGRSGSGRDFYMLHAGSTPLATGMASAVDWLCAASFLSLFGLLSVNPQDAQLILTGWLAGLVLMAVWVAPAQFHTGQLCLSAYLGSGYNSRLVEFFAFVMVVTISTLLLALQLRGMSLVFSRHLQLSVQAGVIISMLLLLFYVVLGAMKALTQVQILQYCILLCALMVPTSYLAGAFGQRLDVLFSGGVEAASTLSHLRQQLGFTPDSSSRSSLDVLLLLVALVAGVAVLPHLLLRYQSVKKTTDIAHGAVWMLVFLGLIYSSMPFIASLGELRLIQEVNGELNDGSAYSRMPDWYYGWEQSKQLVWYDHTQDGKVQYAAGHPFDGIAPEYSDATGMSGEPLIQNPAAGIFEPLQQRFPSELFVAEELRLFLIPEVSAMPVWVIGLLSVGIMAAILSSASVLMIAVAHAATVLIGSSQIKQRVEFKLVRLVVVLVLLLAGIIAFMLPGSLVMWFNRIVALAAATLFPAALLLIFKPGLHSYAVLSGMLAGLSGFLLYFFWFNQHAAQTGQTPLISLEAFGACAMLLNFAVTLLMAVFFKGVASRIK